MIWLVCILGIILIIGLMFIWKRIVDIISEDDYFDDEPYDIDSADPGNNE